jgi:hypothetical protein
MLALFVFGWVAGVSYRHHFIASGGKPHFYQDRFAPAVSFACGHGYRTTKQREIAAFLNGDAERFDCDILDPSQLTDRLTAFDRISRYLLGSVGIIWRVRGLTWAALDPLFGFLAGATALLAYGVLRMGVAAPLAALVTLLFVTSPFNLGMVPHLRDYAKAPFLIGALLIVGFVIRGPRSRAQLVGAAAIAGALFGIGLGFRNDILIAAAPLLLALLVAPVHDRRPATTRALTLAAFAVATAIVGWPILRAYAGGSNTGHVIILGLTEPFSRQLQVQPSFYDFGHLYDDSYAYSVVNAFAQRTGRVQPGGVKLGTAEYDREAMRYLGHLAITFPADFVVRAYAAVGRVLSFPAAARYPDARPAPPWLERLVDFRSGIAAALRWLLLPMAAIAWILVSLASPRAGFVSLAVVAVFAGGAMLQFSPRHVFYLEILPWWAVAFCVQAVASTVQAGWRAGGRRTLGAHARRGAPGWLLVLAIAVAVPALLGLARAAQKSSVRDLFERYLSAPRRTLPTTRATTGPDVLVSPDLGDNLALSPDRPTRVTLLRADFGGPSCDFLVVNPRIRYAPGSGQRLSRRVTVHVPPPPAVTSVFVPVLSYTGAELVGLEFAHEEGECLASLALVDDGALPVLVPATLGPGWTAATRFQTFDWETRRDTQQPGWRVFTDPEGLPARRSAADAVGLLDPSEIEAGDPRLQRQRQALLFTGRLEREVLLQSRLTDVPGGSIAVVAGELAEGTLKLTLLDRSGRLVRQIVVDEGGRFTAAMHAPRSAPYRLRITADRAATLRAVLRQVGWVRRVKQS